MWNMANPNEHQEIVDIAGQLGKAARQFMEKEWANCGGKPEDFPEPGPFCVNGVWIMDAPNKNKYRKSDK